MAKVAVIFDTNACHSRRETQSFFGYRPIMTEIASRAEILLPQVVVNELIQQNAEGTLENIEALKSNSLLTELGFDIKLLESVDGDKHAMKIYENEAIAHKVVRVEKPEEAYRKIEKWSVAGSPPFNERKKDGKNNSDKGIKDAIVACTVDEILAADKYDIYYLACRDTRLKDYFRDNKRIACLSPEEILDELKKEFFDEYTLARTKEELNWPSITLKDEWININSDIVGLFEYEEYEIAVIFDKASKEILETRDLLLIDRGEVLQISGSFSSTHDVVAKITDSLIYYSFDDLMKIRSALISNDQVYGIGTDDDIKALAEQIYRYFLYDLSQEDRKLFMSYYNIREES